jgi:hypothetical protein
MLYDMLSTFDPVFNPEVHDLDLNNTIADTLNKIKSRSKVTPTKYSDLLTSYIRQPKPLNSKDIVDLIFRAYGTSVKEVEGAARHLESGNIFKNILYDKGYTVEAVEPKDLQDNFSYKGTHIKGDKNNPEETRAYQFSVIFSRGQVTSGLDFSLTLKKYRKLSLKEMLEKEEIDELSRSFRLEFPVIEDTVVVPRTVSRHGTNHGQIKPGTLYKDLRNYMVDEMKHWRAWGVPLTFDKLTEDYVDEVLESSDLDKLDIYICNKYRDEPYFSLSLKPKHQELHVRTKEITPESWTNVKELFQKGERALS